MNTTVKIILIVTLMLFASGTLVAGGFWFGRNMGARISFFHPPAFSPQGARGFSVGCAFRPFGGSPAREFFLGPSSPGQIAPRRRGMMPWPFSPSGGTEGEVPGMAEAREIFEEYLTRWGNDDLALEEVMLFDQNGYAIVTERGSGMGALELLLDYETLAVYPEYGPARMWNLKYGMMGRGMMRWGATPYQPVAGIDSIAMPVSAQKAKELGQGYLDQNMAGSIIAGNGMAFYGYYTFDFSRDGKPAGMLSVNGFSSQIWPHTWHGNFLEEWEAQE